MKMRSLFLWNCLKAMEKIVSYTKDLCYAVTIQSGFRKCDSEKFIVHEGEKIKWKKKA